MKTPIVMTCWRRPKYLRQVLEALASCRGFGDRAVYVYLDGGGMTVPQFYESLKPVPIKQVRTFPSQMNLGCTNNSIRALDETFKATNESHVILLEEDVEPKADFLEWAAWAEAEGMPAARSTGFPVLSAAAWWPRLLPGRRMAGHDYHPTWPGVIEAVTKEFRGTHRVAGSVWSVEKAGGR